MTLIAQNVESLYGSTSFIQLFDLNSESGCATDDGSIVGTSPLARNLYQTSKASLKSLKESMAELFPAFLVNKYLAVELTVTLKGLLQSTPNKLV